MSWASGLAAGVAVGVLLGVVLWTRGAPLDAAGLVFVTLAVTLAAGEAALSRDGERDPVRARRQRLRGLEWLTALGLLTFQLLALRSHAHGALTLVSGGALMLLGLVLRLAAVAQLGAAFVTGAEVAEGQPLVTTGLYGRIRHPSELGLLAFVLGGALVQRAELLGLATLATLTFASAIRIRREDALLAREYGTAFEIYRQRVGGLWPRL